ncbi:hypothetical protein AB1Y20_006756 [Prymnesium parvum]|uniref:Calcineurin-like phosphoesterase domain-containing protein n=1 Tax=Prymnesium parvum TaxID=97485 RepID=A0AB34J1A1_PRYPA
MSSLMLLAALVVWTHWMSPWLFNLLLAKSHETGAPTAHPAGVAALEASEITNRPAISAGHRGGLCALGDLHGDPLHALRALRLCGAVGDDWTWVGGQMTIVQVGDVLDRGNASITLLEHLWDLRDQATAAGGELVLLLGNHELLNMQGRTRYVHHKELEAFGGKTRWQNAFDPTSGAYGKRLAAQDAFAVRGHGSCRTLFNHGGLRARLAAKFGSVGALNHALQTQLTQMNGELLDARDGPLWFRGYAIPQLAALTEQAACDELAMTLATVGDGATRMAVGHNIVPWISSRCGGALQLIDVGMSSAYLGRPAAWRCDEDTRANVSIVRALYEGDALSEEPPELCAACASVSPRARLLRSTSHEVLRIDPHGDCPNYC